MSSRSLVSSDPSSPSSSDTSLNTPLRAGPRPSHRSSPRWLAWSVRLVHRLECCWNLNSATAWRTTASALSIIACALHHALYHALLSLVRLVVYCVCPTQFCTIHALHRALYHASHRAHPTVHHRAHRTVHHTAHHILIVHCTSAWRRLQLEIVERVAWVHPCTAGTARRGHRAWPPWLRTDLVGWG